jgi:hypothetical protein
MANEIRIKLQPLGNLKCFIYCLNLLNNYNYYRFDKKKSCPIPGQILSNISLSIMH